MADQSAEAHGVRVLEGPVARDGEQDQDGQARGGDPGQDQALAALVEVDDRQLERRSAQHAQQGRGHAAGRHAGEGQVDEDARVRVLEGADQVREHQRQAHGRGQKSQRDAGQAQRVAPEAGGRLRSHIHAPIISNRFRV